MTFWAEKAPSANNLRLFESASGWREFADSKDQQENTMPGASRAIDLHLSGAMNANNLLLLTGAGSSLCATGSTKPPRMADLWEAAKSAVSDETFRKILASIPKAVDSDQNVERLLTLCKLYVALFDQAESKVVSDFISAAEQAILRIVDFVDASTNLTSHRLLVRKIARRSARKPRCKIFTTNYDLCFEYAAQQQRFVVIDGFSHTLPQAYDRSHFSHDVVRRANADGGPDYIENVFHLYKLHGSVDWRRGPSGIVRSKDNKDGEPVLIYPRDSKYQEAFEAPYLDMMGAFQMSMREPDTALIISGFGFNDDHIAKPIIAAVEANTSLKLVVCDVGFIPEQSLVSGSQTLPDDANWSPKNAHLAWLKQLVRVGDQRIVLLNGRFSDLVSALPDLVAETERERHEGRIKLARDAAGQRKK